VLVLQIGPSGACGLGNIPSSAVVEINSGASVTAGLPSRGCGSCLRVSCTDKVRGVFVAELFDTKVPLLPTEFIRWLKSMLRSWVSDLLTQLTRALACRCAKGGQQSLEWLNHALPATSPPHRMLLHSSSAAPQHRHQAFPSCLNW
jgi:hypothetical protein